MQTRYRKGKFEDGITEIERLIHENEKLLALASLGNLREEALARVEKNMDKIMETYPKIVAPKLAVLDKPPPHKVNLVRETQLVATSSKERRYTMWSKQSNEKFLKAVEIHGNDLPAISKALGMDRSIVKPHLRNYNLRLQRATFSAEHDQENEEKEEPKRIPLQILSKSEVNRRNEDTNSSSNLQKLLSQPKPKPKPKDSDPVPQWQPSAQPSQWRPTVENLLNTDEDDFNIYVPPSQEEVRAAARILSSLR